MSSRNSYARPPVRALGLRVFCSLAVALGPGLSGAEEPTRPDAYKPLGPNLFPIYQHYLRTADETEVTNVLYLFTRTFSRKTGGSSSFLFPLFHRSRQAEPPRSHLSIFPLLFFQGSAPERSYVHWIPLYHERSGPDFFYRFAVPLWLHTERGGVSRRHVLPPLFRHSADRSAPDRAASAIRFGLPYLLELFETRREEGASGFTAFNFFNWREETRGGLPVFQRFSEEGRRGIHLFPFFFDYRRAPSRFHALFPLYAFSSDGTDEDLWLPPLLGRVGWGEDDRRRIDALFPLFHYSADKRSYDIYSFPLFHVSADRPENRWLSLGVLYHTSIQREKGKRTHSFLYPLSRFDNEPDGSRGDNWFFPYIETYDDKRLWRFFVPLYWEYQSLAGGKTDWFFRLGLPTHLSVGKPDDYFSTFFPLYWSNVSADRGWRFFVPLYFDRFTPTSRTTHLFPFVSARSVPSRKQLFILGPLYVNERFFGLRRERTGTANHFLWPLVTIENRTDGYRYSAFPFFHTSRRGDSRDLLLSPFYYQVDGPSGRGRYFIPFWGRYESPSTTTDYYALASYVRSRDRDEKGNFYSDRHYALWSLVAHEEDSSKALTHTRVLPLGYWSRSAPRESFALAFPFYYGFRTKVGSQTERFNLFLGNLFFSRTVERRSPGEAAPQELWREWGILFPLSWAYRSVTGDRTRWAFPLYFDSKRAGRWKFGLFPLFYRQADSGPYEINFFRHFFLGDYETWPGGYRVSAGQLLFDWKADETAESYRLRLAYPILEHAWDKEGYTFSFTPLCVFSLRGDVLKNYIFPVYWQGATYRSEEGGERRAVERHFFLFPLYGHIVRRAYRDDYAPFPILHVRTSADTLRWELWPLLFYRDEPALFAMRIWPLHADESRVNAGESWISRWLYVSKRFEVEGGYRYRLDPFIFSISKTPSELDVRALFSLWGWYASERSRAVWAAPLWGWKSDDDKSAFGVFPLYYYRANKTRGASYWLPGRFFFLSNRLKGADGERHTSVLWRAFEHTDNPNRPQFSELGFLYRLFFARRSEVSRTFAVNPFYSYYRNDQDDETEHAFLFSIYRHRRVAGRVSRTLFWGLEF